MSPLCRVICKHLLHLLTLIIICRRQKVTLRRRGKSSLKYKIRRPVASRFSSRKTSASRFPISIRFGIGANAYGERKNDLPLNLYNTATANPSGVDIFRERDKKRIITKSIYGKKRGRNFIFFKTINAYIAVTYVLCGVEGCKN